MDLHNVPFCKYLYIEYTLNTHWWSYNFTMWATLSYIHMNDYIWSYIICIHKHMSIFFNQFWPTYKKHRTHRPIDSWYGLGMEIAVQFRLIFLRAKEAFLEEGKKMQKRFNSSLDWWDCVYVSIFFVGCC